MGSDLKNQNGSAILSYSEFFKGLASQYGDMPRANVEIALLRAVPFGAAYTNNPFIQNRRVKSTVGLPRDVTKSEIVDMLQAPDQNEEGLRSVSRMLEYTAMHPGRESVLLPQSCNGQVAQQRGQRVFATTPARMGKDCRVQQHH